MGDYSGLPQEAELGPKGENAEESEGSGSPGGSCVTHPGGFSSLQYPSLKTYGVFQSKDDSYSSVDSDRFS